MKRTKETISGYSPDIIAQQREKLKSLFPEIVADGKIDFEKLKLTLGDDLIIADERYVLNWAGKSDAFRAIQAPTAATLKPKRDESVNFDTTQNVFIEGENLEVLKVLQKAYYNKIKMIYIDPPYNTGSDSFIYPDKFSESKDEYLKRIGDKDDEGYLTKEGLFRKNSKDSGRYHSNWLSMMYPRLFLARNLLKDDGVIFVSIDDNEVHNLRLLMNEIYGEDNLVAEIVIQSNKRGQTYKDIAKTHEYLLCYTKHFDVDLNELEKGVTDLTYKDTIGEFSIRELRNRNPKFGKFNRPNLFYPIYVSETNKDSEGFHLISLLKDQRFNIEVLPFNSEGKESCWRWSRQLVNKQNSNDVATSPVVAKQKRDGGWNIYEKYRKSTYKAKTIWDETSVISEKGTIDLKGLGMQGLFDHPKPVELLMKAIRIGSISEDIILDFFAGSGTLMHAVMEVNKEDGDDRKYICVQLSEKTHEDSDAFKAGYKTIADVCKERIRRVIKSIKKEIETQPGLFQGNELDLGFKALRL